MVVRGGERGQVPERLPRLAFRWPHSFCREALRPSSVASCPFLLRASDRFSLLWSLGASPLACGSFRPHLCEEPHLQRLQRPPGRGPCPAGTRTTALQAGAARAQAPRPSSGLRGTIAP